MVDLQAVNLQASTSRFEIWLAHSPWIKSSHLIVGSHSSGYIISTSQPIHRTNFYIELRPSHSIQTPQPYTNQNAPWCNFRPESSWYTLAGRGPTNCSQTFSARTVSSHIFWHLPYTKAVSKNRQNRSTAYHDRHWRQSHSIFIFSRFSDIRT